MERLDLRRRWDHLIEPLGILTLIGVRNILRQQNLVDTSQQPSVGAPTAPEYEARFATERTADGSWNDLKNPVMGMTGTRFGRNVPILKTWPEPPERILKPNPREVSRRLMTRTEFLPVTAGNALIATWLQFMLRDWVRHGSSPTDDPWILPVEPGDPWPDPTVTVLRSPPDPTTPPDSKLPPTWINTLSHWWDGSQIYGQNLAEQRSLRSYEQGKLLIEEKQSDPGDPARNPTLVPGYWLGVAMMQTLFSREHNAVCDHLAKAYPDWDDEKLFQRARLITAALLARIHTVEWTPAVTAHPTAAFGVRANWYGLAGEKLQNLGVRFGSSEELSGIIGGPTNHYGVPFSMTEEFVAVYRMHPLVPDSYDFRSAKDDSPTLGAREFDELAGPEGAEVLRTNRLGDLLYTFGTMNPGLITLHNYPVYLQKFRRPDNKELMDLSATDILRCRELGVPRYLEFRRLLHLTVPKTFDEITSNPVWAEELNQVYGGDLEEVDLISGMFAEDRPEGFAFSDTAFRIFILMASRRLNSDRFFTRDFTPKVYTPEGIHWIAHNTMGTVLARHCPELRPYLAGVSNAFALWPRAGQS
jgi:hypothetical protein